MRKSKSQDTKQGAISCFFTKNIPFLVHNFKLNRALLSFVVTTTDKAKVQLVAKIFEDYRLRATFAFSTGFIGMQDMADSRDVLSLSKKNHEIALQSRRGEVINKMSESFLNLDLHRSIRDIFAMTGVKPTHFTYPQGMCSIANKFRLGDKMRSSLSSLEGVNHGIVDLHFLKSALLQDFDKIENYIDKTRECRGFLIFKITDETSESMVRYAIDAALMRGISIYTMSDALDFAGVPQKTSRSIGYSSTPENNAKPKATAFDSPVRTSLSKVRI